MYTLDLICSNGHGFEGWFANRAVFEHQRDEGLITCPSCGDKSVEQSLSPVRIMRHADAKDAASPPAPKPNVLQYIEKHFEDVGANFASEAMDIHAGEAEHRNIRGTATPDEEKALTEKGISFFKLPSFQ